MANHMENNIVLTILKWVADIYIAIIRGTPVYVQMLIIYFIIFAKMDTSPLIPAILCFGINSSAYVAEIIRAGIEAVDPGQMEAGRSLGLSWTQTMISIIMPQAIKNILPALGNEFIALIKETSVVSFVGAADLYKAFNVIGSNSYEFMVPYIVMALIYIVLVLIISLAIRLMERSLGKSDRRN
jgi:polar amino acid transport system permease protein